ncbi:MAG: polyphosphate kinase 1 [Actinomycetota bacterium]
MTDLDERFEVVAAPHLGVAERFLNRELSWLDFNARVLALAEDSNRPLLERAKFLAIFSQNFDEFFQVRVAGLKMQVRSGVGRQAAEALSPSEQLDAIRERVVSLTARRDLLFVDEIAPALAKEGVSFCSWDDLSSDEQTTLAAYFDVQIHPVLTPLAVDPGHPFPYISDLSLNLAVVISDPTEPEPRFARVKVPPSLDRFIPLPDGERFLPFEQLIAARLETLFPGMQIVAHHPFRVTRNADLDVEEDEADDLLEAIETGLRQRRRSPHVVRLEIGPGLADYVREVLLDELDLDGADVYSGPAPLDLGGLWSIYALDRPDLKDEPWKPVTPGRFAGMRRRRSITPGASSVDHRAPAFADADTSVFDVLRAGDQLLHHPYDSFTTSVETFIEQAADDPHVLAIKWTLYRTSGPESPIIRNLIRAAENGKQVVALVELKARFDEEANIAWARALEEAGVHVVYGLVGLKTHAKIALIVRQEGGKLTRYTHVGTGNYNPNTATVYEDVGVLSADPDVGADLSDLFNFLTGYSRQRAFRKILVAPLMLRDQLLDMIGDESARPNGRILMKLNHLVDPEMIDALYAASQRGAKVELIVRGVCSLRPGVPELSENIRVRSILGRYLEHSRIFRFGAEPRSATYYIGSADLMRRNLDGRVEVLLPITDPVLKNRLSEILDVNLSDDALAWELSADGNWKHVSGDSGLDAHRELQRLAIARTQTAQSGP